MDTSLSVSYVEKEDIPYIWDVIEPEIERAIKHDPDPYNPKRFREQLENGDMLLWFILKGHKVVATMTTEVNVRWNEKILLVVTISGEGMDEWLDMVISHLVKYRDQLGCNRIRTLCRDGMAKNLRVVTGKRLAQ